MSIGKLRYKHEEVIDWPPWVPGISGFIALVAVLVAVVQRQSAGHDLRRPFFAAALILIPFALDVAQLRTNRRIAFSRLFFAIPVLIGTTLLVFSPTPVDFAPFVLVFLSAEMAARSEDQVWFGLAVNLAGIAIMVAADIFGPFDESFIWVIGISFGWFGGFLVQRLSMRTYELNQAYGELAEKAAAEERQRIAREVHDVIAHSLSVTMLHVTAARMAMQRGDRPDDALDALREAEQQGRKSLAEIRRTVGLLGSDDDATAPPLPTASDLPALVRQFRDAGVDASLTIDGDVTALPPAAGLNIYRIVQESLTNVAKHAPQAKASVELNVDEDDIRLRVHNTAGNGTAPATSASGIGLRGMAERAATLGGTLQTDDGDGWTVSVVAPRKTT